MKKQSGFSLMEILIVLSIMAVMITVVVARPRNQQKAYKRYFRQLSLMSKEIKNRAKLEGSTYRMVFYLENNKPPQITVEKNPKSFLLGDEKEAKAKIEDMLKKRRSKKTAKKTKSKKDKGDGFSPSSRFNPQNLNMPPDLKIKFMEVAGLDESLRDSGLLMFYYFPHGLVEEAIVHITNGDESLKWTLLTDSLTGEIHRYGDHLDLKDFQNL